MTGPIRRFDPAELLFPGETAPSAADMADSLLTARELEALAMDTSIRPSDGFEDRVMAAIASEPAPRLVLLPASSVRGGRLGAFLVAIRQSWAIATTGGRPMAVRAQALGFVFLVFLAAGALTGVTAVGVGALLGPNGATGPDASPIPTAPAPAPTPDVATEGPTPSVSPEPTPTEPAETAEPTETPGLTRTPRPTEADETPEPNETPEATDDSSGPDGGGDDNSGPGGGGGGDDGGNSGSGGGGSSGSGNGGSSGSGSGGGGSSGPG